jgi:hypothetical protein
MCSYLHVVKCRYCARVGETLKYVAEQYNFDTNWLRLWNYNYHITDPVCQRMRMRRHGCGRSSASCSLARDLSGSAPCLVAACVSASLAVCCCCTCCCGCDLVATLLRL